MSRRGGRGRGGDDPNLAGLLLIDKPSGWTSHDVVARCRSLLKVRRIGHSGTLDPSATGLLLIGVGWLTRVLRFTNVLPKTYRGEIVFGTETSTMDAEGEVIDSAVMDIEPADIEKALGGFVGDIDQIPPMVSAIKVGGEALHVKARRGEEIEREPRPVSVYEFRLLKFADNIATVEVKCSAGTYVRVLAHDLGIALGGCAHLRNLRRIRIGPHDVENAISLEDLEKRGTSALLPPANAIAGLPALTLSAAQAELVATGRPLAPDEMPPDLDGQTVDTPFGVLGPEGQLIGIYQATEAGRPAKPLCVAPNAGADHQAEHNV